MNGASAPVLEARSLAREFGVSGGFFRRKLRFSAVRDISLRLERGEVLALVGESGSGKTTLAKMLLGLLPPSAGDIWIDGRSIRSIDRRALARRIQPIFQDPYSSLNPRKRIGSIIGLPLYTLGIGDRAERRRRVLEVMERVGLAGRYFDATPNQLSGGQRQRVAIARALVTSPDVIICDEPTSALDVSVQAQILNLLEELRRDLGLTYLIISHNLAVVERMATRIMVMYLGRIVEEDDTETFFRSPRHPYSKTLLAAVLPPKLGQGLPAVDMNATFPNPLAPPPGCSFHPRCSVATDQCRRIPPRLVREARRAVECHLFDSADSAVCRD